MERILLLEDDKSLVTGLTLALGRAGYALDTARYPGRGRASVAGGPLRPADAGRDPAGRHRLRLLPGGAPHFRGAHPVSDRVG